MNCVNITGYLTKELSLKILENGTKVLNIRLANNQSKKNTSGEYEVCFFNMVAYNQIAENMCQHLKKGDRIGVTGKLISEQYRDKENREYEITKIIIQHVDYLM
ncbi:single-stranded DNA-binding protein [Granulicatella sp. zg-ZJ]|uniref:single-stranded DNA-binding protein n=1 Tax=Granulicatella sp. zg-ZJ TaxID=2678504 RepID=UPI0013D23887|nr:single-stranded DNA-binding protein [Granulicatella sp. zg-ZJ]NEW62425.1 single-stranded DNA-binding protein [Granulicatella sp. zg-ZJ]